MLEINLHFEFISEVAYQRISRIYTAVLSSGATKADRQMFKAAFNIIFNRNINDIKNTIQEFYHFGLLFQIIFHFLVSSRFGFHGFNSPGIENASAVKHKSSAIATFIFWYSIAIGETADLNYK